jgi:BMFP domain-containing protein YqiC
MINSATLDDLAARIGRAIESSPAKDLDKNLKALVGGALARLDVVPRAEFDLQQQVLKRTREKLEALEGRVAALEAALAGPADAPASASADLPAD